MHDIVTLFAEKHARYVYILFLKETKKSQYFDPITNFKLVDGNKMGLHVHLFSAISL